MPTYETMSVIDLSQELKRLSRKLFTLQQDARSIVPKLPEDYVRAADLEQQIEEVKSERVAVGKLLLEADKATEARRAERAEEAARERDAKLNAYCTSLKKFAKNLNALTNLGAEYEALMAEGREIEKLNNSATKRKPIGVILPSRQRDLLRKTLVSTFGLQAIAGITRQEGCPRDSVYPMALTNAAIQQAKDA